MSDPELIVHKRMAPAPKQVKFPGRRHNTRSGASRSLPPKLLKRQSTLTQLDFVSTPSGSREAILISSDDDEEYSERKPKRRKKKIPDKRARDQSSLTQNWRREARNQDKGNSDGEFADWEEDATIMDNIPESKAQDTQGIGKYLYGRVQEVSSEMQEIAGDGQSVASPPTRQHRMLAASSDAGDRSTRPTTADSKANPKTPKTARRTEVPSSQTPSSAILSVNQSRRHRVYDVSPLKRRSCTPTPLKNLPPSQTSSPSRRMLKHMDSDIRSLDALASVDTKSEPWKAEVVASPRLKPMSPPARRRLIRTTTVQDSQDDLGLEQSSDIGLAERRQDLLGLEEFLEPKSTGRSLKRTSTVLDSQSESDLDDVHMEDEEDITEVPVQLEASEKQPEEVCKTVQGSITDITQPYQKSLDNHDIDDETYYDAREEGFSHDYTYTASLQQQTFDPVSAALDRDAARFGRGPTQLYTQFTSDADSGRGSHSEQRIKLEKGEDEAEDESADVVMHDNEERVDDSEPEFVAESPVEADPETQFVADSPPAEVQYQPSPELGNPTQAPKLASSGGRVSAVDGPNTIDYPQSMAVVPDAEDLELPMPLSPKQPRPSQVSTVVSTQRTSSRPNSGHGNGPASPQKSAAWANAFSSSPFPLPPESWRAAQSNRDFETQSSDIFDFSLPPPPPLLSSARQTPASSSR